LAGILFTTGSRPAAHNSHRQFPTEGWSKAEGEHMPQISFSADIKPLFSVIDISHMKRFGVELDSYAYMSNPDNANKVLATLSPHDGEPPTMPPGGPYWTGDQLALFTQWQSDGYQP
jgi:hypothetical protein